MLIRQGVFGRKAEIGRAGRNGRGDVRAFALLDVDIDIAMVAQECRQRLRQMLGQTGRIGQQMNAGLGAAGESGEIAAHRIDIMDDDPGVIEQAFAGRGQLDAAAAALQQYDAKRSLEALDPRAGRRQREMGSQRAAA